MVVEIIADGRKHAVRHIIETDGGEVELRTCHRHEYINKVVNEKRGDEHERHLFEPLEAEKEVVERHHQYHGVIEEVPLY